MAPTNSPRHPLSHQNVDSAHQTLPKAYHAPCIVFFATSSIAIITPIAPAIYQLSVAMESCTGRWYA